MSAAATSAGAESVGSRRRAAAIAHVAAAALCLCGCSRLFGARATLGPGAIVRGRGLYNEVISSTNNEQTLELIVHARYGEPSGLLSVSSITANLRTSTLTAAQFGIGPSSNYSGNIVPLSVGVAYEENPTIAYTPVQGERFAKAILAPVGLDVLVLLGGIEHAPAKLISILVKQVNGLQNPLYGPPESYADFDAAIALLERLQLVGQATWTSTSTKTGGFALVIHDYAATNRDVVRDLLRMWGLSPSLARTDRDIVLPVSLAVGRATKPELNVQTRSVYDLIELAARAVEVPPEHAALHLADPELAGVSSFRGVMRIHSSSSRPSTDVLVAVRHRGYWFYIAADDGPSKLAFRLLHTLIGMRLVEGTPQTVPTLTIPVGR
ncbi:MAG TPA: hypothetical protein VMS22_05310 [Candidatus Eisenbacteria bacterium]|nr:hypothetical protein [Candidatus Eisenbacteria bacterium]